MIEHTRAIAVENSPRSRDPGRDRIVPVLVLSLGAIVVLLGFDELLEHFILRGFTPIVSQGVCLVFGFITMFAAVILGGWLVGRDSPPLLQTYDCNDQATNHQLDARIMAGQNSSWFIRMRWVAIVVSTTLVYFATRATSLVNPAAMAPLLTVEAILVIVNLFYPVLAHYDRLWKINVPVQVVVDLFLLVMMLHYSGGVENPISILLVLHVIIGGVLLGRAWCYTVACVASIFYSSLIWLEWIHWIPHHPIRIFPPSFDATPGLAFQTVYVSMQTALHSAMLLLVALFVGTLGERTRSHEVRLRALADEAKADHHLLEQAIETTDTAIRVIDRQLQPTFVNSRWLEWTGGISPDKNDDPSYIPENEAALTMKDGVTRVSQFTVATSTGSCSGDGVGSSRIIRLTTAAFHRQEDGVEQVVQLGQDITELTEHQEHMVRASQLAAVGELAGQVAHEVNNPIAIISAKARLLLSNHRDELSDRTERELTKIIDLSDRVARIAQGLLSSCRPSPGSRTIENLIPLVHHAISLIEARSMTIGVTIVEELSVAPIFAKINPGEMQQVVLNILLNAMDAMPDGGVLHVMCHDDGVTIGDETPAVSLTIEDTGAGIDATIRERVFIPFFSTKRDGKGTGLGLSICHGIINGFSGEIEIGNAPSGGARVEIRLPSVPVPGDSSFA